MLENIYFHARENLREHTKHFWGI